MKNYKLLVELLRWKHSKKQLEEMFIQREDEDLFAEVGQLAHPGLLNPYDVWLGYEIVSNSKQCSPNYKV